MLNTTKQLGINEEPPSIEVTVASGTPAQRSYEYSEEFIIGRRANCQIQLKEPVISRSHCRVFYDNGHWWIEDLQSANGIYVDGQRCDRQCIDHPTMVRLGSSGPILEFCVQIASQPPAESTNSLDHYKSHFFTDLDGPAGEHTMMVRRAYAEVQKKQKRLYYAITVLAAILVITSVSYAVFRHVQYTKQRQLAATIFYQMKTLEVRLAQLINTTQQERSRETDQKIRKFERHQQQMEHSYNQFTDTLHVYEKKMNEEDKLILKIARRFGECEINMPEDFTKKVKEHIKKWKETGRLQRAVQHAQSKGYIKTIAQTMIDHGLPPQFFYLALQESNLNINAIGPLTRFGIAKGMWQFIPKTANRYGLHPGPLVDEPEVDPKDDRHHFDRSTLAAARYLRDIYATEAQASGLLVMASYNWGEHRILPLLRSMPQNPRERNFWNLLGKYRDKIPAQTYDYVFSIIAAAVIGENPRLFGFDFDNPLADFDNYQQGLF